MANKLFIQIPCLNEEKTLPSVIADLPRSIEGIDEIYTLVIDDCSHDGTVETARSLGVDFIVRNHRNIGLARSFQKGLEACLHLGADIIVNTDGDHQYRGPDIARLVRPILEKKADITIGCRKIEGHPEFSLTKKKLQKLGSKVVEWLSGIKIPDATSGFRAMSRESAIRFTFMSNFSYTLEMLIQAGSSGLQIEWIPIETNPKTREPRLFQSVSVFLAKQIKTLLTIFLFYRPMYCFGFLSLLCFILSVLLGFRIIYFLWFADPTLMKFKEGSGALLLIASIFCIVFMIAGLLGSVLSGLRFISIDVRSRIRNLEIQQNLKPLDVDIIQSPQLFRWASLSHRETSGLVHKVTG